MPLTTLLATTTLQELTTALEERCRDLVTHTVRDVSRALRGKQMTLDDTLPALIEDILQGSTQIGDHCRWCHSAHPLLPTSPCYAAALQEFKRRIAAL